MLITTILSLLAFANPTDPLFDEVIAHVEDDYLWVEDIQSRNALIHAAERIETLLPWLLIKATADHLILQHGEGTEIGRIPFPTYYRDIENSLEMVQGLIIRESRKGYEVPEDMDLELELLYGLTQALDAYTVLLFSEKLKRFNERINGKLSGIGCRVRRHSEGLEILEVFPDGPAARGMLKKGDLIVTVDGGSLRGLSTEQGVNRLRGESGTPVEIEYYPNWSVQKKEEGFELQQLDKKKSQLIRSTVRIPNVHWEIKDNIGIVTIDNFSQQTNRFLYEALEQFEKEKVKGIVIDLRDNSGGSMLQSCRLLDRFLDEGLILRTSGRDGKTPNRLMKDYVAKESNNDIDLPLLVLINEDSASASEIVAGSLKLHQRALLIGERTYGKGLIQLPFRLRTGDAAGSVTLKMTVAQYLLKDDFSVHEANGVEPDIWLTPFYLYDKGIYVSDDTHGLVYAVEREGWNETSDESILQKDFALDFATQVLQKQGTLDELRSYAKQLQVQEQVREWHFISKELQDKKNIDWQGAPFIIDGDIPILDTPPFDVFLSVVGAPIAGEDVDLRIQVNNKSSKPLHRTRVHLHADDRHLPWDDIVIPIGYIPPNSTGIQLRRVTIPDYMSSRIDPVYMTTFVEGLGQSQITEVPLQIHQIETPNFFIDTDVQNIEDDIWQMEVIFHNRGKSELKDLSLQLHIPNTKTVEFLSGDLLELSTISQNSQISHQFRFRFPIRDEAEDGLYEEDFEIKVNSESMARKHVVAATLDELVHGHFEAPSIDLTLPTRALVGDLPLDIHLNDDGKIAQSRVCLDGEKQYWTQKSDYTMTLELTSGQHHIAVIAEDNQGLQTRIDKYIYVQPTKELSE
jgi:C-terminal peptidase prc